VTAFDLVILLAGNACFAPPLKRQPIVVHVDAHLIARQSREFSGEHKCIGGFAEIDGRRPALRTMRRQALEAVLDADEVAERVPARKDHDSRIVARASCWAESGSVC